jgi:sulfur carrier protein
MQVIVNGSPHRFESPPTIDELVQSLGLAGRRLAIEVNREIVPRGRHAEHRLADGDEIELVQAMGGG